MLAGNPGSSKYTESDSSRSRQSTSTGDGDEDEQDEPSSNQNSETVDELSTFRAQWKKELKSSPEHQSVFKREQSAATDAVPETIEDQARALFLKGIQHEQDGKLYEAVKFYRRAVQLVPDIETHLYEATKTKAAPLEVNLEALTLEEDAAEDEAADATEEEEDDLLLRFQRILLRDQAVCHADLPQSAVHISSLPMEIVLYILKWVVSSELDVRLLDLSCSAVCRGFYLAARDPEIWRLVCVRVWGVNCGGLSNFESWRQMYIQRPHIYFHGCYISKTTYIRHGENSFQDQFYRPWHLVEYFRYLRFFPEGLVLMLTTPEDPPVSLKELKHRNPRNSTVLRGHYRLHDDHVTIVLKREPEKGSGTNNKIRNKRRGDALWNEPSEQTFHLELQIGSHRSHRHVQLHWQGYSVITHRGATESSTSFDLISGRFPPFHFSRVKSYTAESENILQ
ncbi:F-box only protein 9 [Frankliniella fusca]|uniref:F-box only protein 9 n=1 Tax=Frankliniella fusca TaxID=407009 RepID=A0AAE1HHQ9_9NEOP|nr:F-box only protein 9 [Frankliniella fusca]